MTHLRANAIVHSLLVFGGVSAWHGFAAAQPTGAPPPEADKLVSAPKDAPKAPTKEEKLDVTTAAVSAGGQVSTGNSQLTAATLTGNYETRIHDNGVGFSLVGNYGQSATPGHEQHITVQNLQGRIRYDRYLTDPLAVFLLNTGRHDRFQGLDFRYNLDPGVRYQFVQTGRTMGWGEAGYDFQYDVRRDSSIEEPVNGVMTRTQPKTATDHSTRLFYGFRHAFNDAVNLYMGVEYLQSVVHSYQYRINYDALLAAKLFGNLAIGAGFSVRYDHHPLDHIEKVDTQTVLSLIYSYSSAAPPAEKPEPLPCPPAPACPTAAPAPEPAQPLPSPAPSSATPAPPAAATEAPVPPQPVPAAPPPSTTVP